VLAAIAIALAADAATAQTLQQRVDAVAAKGGVAWIEYRVPMLDGSRRLCCFDAAQRSGNCCGQCRLEDRDGVVLTGGGPAATPSSRITIEPPGEMRVFARLENRSVTRLRIFSLDCDIDAAGAAVTTLSGVSADGSVAWLAALIRGAGDATSSLNTVHMPALSALALHPGNAAGTALVALARTDPRTRIRSQALFWLAQRAGDEAVRTIGSAVSDDPEIEVKRRAVFALSQLPRDEGVPLLMDLARTHRLPEVRRQAMFWLGQSSDPRAVDFFEQILRQR
jgi:HEAT repeat protein